MPKRYDKRQMSIVDLFEQTEKTLDDLNSPLALDSSSSVRRLPNGSQGSSIDNWVLPHEVETLLLDINQAITSTLPLDDVIRLVLDDIIRLTQTDRGFLMLKEKPRGKLKFIIARDKEKRTLTGTEFDISQGFVKKTLESRTILHKEDALRDQALKNHQSIYHLALRTIICAPLQLGERIIGVIYADSRKKVNHFSEKKLELLKLFVSQAAVAIENARLFRESLRSEQKYRTLVETAQEIIFSIDSKGRIAYVNPALKETLGYSVKSFGSLRGKLRWVHESDRGRMRKLFRQALDGLEVHDVEFRGLHCDGEPRWLSISLHPIHERSRQQLSGVQGVIRDITAQRELYLKMSQNEKIRALGEMAGGVAHDFNNILGIILPRIQMLSARATQELDIRDLKMVEKGARDGEKIVRRIQNFTRSHQFADDLTEIDLNQVIQDAVEMTRPRWEGKQFRGSKKKEYQINTSLEASLPALGSDTELREMITNIIFNALDAMPGGGRVEIRSWDGDDRLHCTIQDTGEGMSEDVLKRVFDPFFTTKGDKGNGLGMSMVYGIINRHQGEIRIESEPGQGTTLSFSLPATVGPPPSKPKKMDREKTVCQKYDILVVDDDAGVRQVLSEILKNFGHQVTTASSGKEAIALTREKTFSVVMTDLSLPEMSGMKVAQTIKSIQKKTTVILVTGWNLPQEEKELQRNGIDMILSKPIVMDQIKAALNRIGKSKS